MTDEDKMWFREALDSLEHAMLADCSEMHTEMNRRFAGVEKKLDKLLGDDFEKASLTGTHEAWNRTTLEGVRLLRRLAGVEKQLDRLVKALENIAMAHERRLKDLEEDKP